MTPEQKAITILLVLLASTVTGIFYLYSQTKISTTGIIATLNVEVYKDQACTTPCTNLDWGMLYPNTSTARVIWVKNKGNINMTIILTRDKLSPPDAQLLELSYDFDTTEYMKPNEIRRIIINLYTPPTVTFVTFTFDIIVTGYDYNAYPPAQR